MSEEPLEILVVEDDPKIAHTIHSGLRDHGHRSVRVGTGKDALVSILEETERLSRMAEQLLLLSRMEADHLRENFVEVDLSDVVRNVLEIYQPIVEVQEIELEQNFADSCVVHGDPTLLMEAVMNLFDNATKWSREDDPLTISTSRAAGSTLLTVSDSGPGINSEFQKHLFEWFNRHESAPYKGSGLGLSIVSEVTRLHGGEIEVDTGEHGGARFKLRLPGSGGFSPHKLTQK